MAEENEGQGQEPTSGEGQGQQESGQQERTFSQGDLDRIVKERLERATARYADYDDLKKKAAELQKLKDSELSETERLKKQMAEMEQAKADAERTAQVRELEINEKLIRAEVRVLAATMGFVSPDDAYRLANLGEVEIDEEGLVKGVDKALKALAKDKPYLLSSDNGKAGVGTPPRGGKRTGGAAEPVQVRVNF